MSKYLFRTSIYYLSTSMLITDDRLIGDGLIMRGHLIGNALDHRALSKDDDFLNGSLVLLDQFG